jgi:hypothetical protein
MFKDEKIKELKRKEEIKQKEKILMSQKSSSVKDPMKKVLQAINAQKQSNMETNGSRSPSYGGPSI